MSLVVVLGASGQGKAVLDVLRAAGEHEVVGFLDRDKPAGSAWCGLPVLGDESVLPGLEVRAVAVAVGDNLARVRVAERLRAAVPGLALAGAVHPAASVSATARLGEGVVVMAGAVVGPDAVVGDLALVNTRASLDHDGVLADGASLAPGVVTGGGVTVGACSAVSLGAVVLHGRSIGAHTVVGAGAVVTRDLPDGVVAWGSPARVVRRREPGERYL